MDAAIQIRVIIIAILVFAIGISGIIFFGRLWVKPEKHYPITHWQDLYPRQQAELLEQIDPDWTDHFLCAEHALSWYDQFANDLVEDALTEYQE